MFQFSKARSPGSIMRSHMRASVIFFEIAAKNPASIARGHALPDANKRTGLAVGLEYLSLNDYEITLDNDLLADAVRDLVTGHINEHDFADVLYPRPITH
ncbi:hypothetical protein [Pseudomonas sp. KNUC1026]|uniref:hypothetical protein n=1 Tax=Pseudomonas sp. KNUC1026 TaxID=2893890 RepID=UPI003FA7731E